MSIVNYTVPYVPPPLLTAPLAPPAANRYLGPDFAFGGAAAINNLLFETPRQNARTSPNRKQTQRGRNPPKTLDPRDPYASYYPSSRSGVSSQYLPTSPERVSSSKPRERPPPPPQPEEPDDGTWPNRPAGYTRITNTYNSVPEPGAKTSVHAVLDFDDDFDDYNYEDEDIEELPPGRQKSPRPHVTPIEGPILIKNGSVPVVPLYSYPTVNNGSLVQIPVSFTYFYFHHYQGFVLGVLIHVGTCTDIYLILAHSSLM